MHGTSGRWWVVGSALTLFLFCCGESSSTSLSAQSASATAATSASSATGTQSTSTGTGQGGDGAGGKAVGGSTASTSGTGGSSVAAGGTGGQGGMCVPGSGPCMDVSGCDYGSCDSPLGWAFDGANCVAMSGCSCAPNCAGFHASLDACMNDCSGYCDADAFQGHVLGPKNWGPGTHCDQVTVCADAPLASQMKTIVPGTMCGGSSVNCPAGQSACVLAFSGKVTASQHADYCKLTLLAGVDAIFCSLFP